MILKPALRQPMDSSRYVIINADDFGLSSGVNAGVIRAHRHGIVTSASLMVRAAAAVEACNYARSNGTLGVGLHIDLAEWEYRSGQWRARYLVVDPSDEVGVRAEVQRQVNQFCELMGRPPTHLDSHQHLHLDEPLKSILRVAAKELRVPLRHFTNGIRYCGSFYGQSSVGAPLHEAIRAEALVAILTSVQSGVTEIACHPGLDDELDTMYCQERKMEVDALCDARVRKALDDEIILTSFELEPTVNASHMVRA